MILYPNAKINLGLAVERRRPDGYHDIATIMLPVDWCDILEIVPADDGRTTLTTYGRPVDCPPEKNLVIKAYHALSDITCGLPPAHFYLEKIIPDGAGMGGGSADAAFALTGLNELFNLGLGKDRLALVAATVGADCPFFIYNRPAWCTGTGTNIEPCSVDGIAGRAILIAKPRVASVSTREAYAGIKPLPCATDIRSVVNLPPAQWAPALYNDFEASIFTKLPAVADVKRRMTDAGAEYTAMTGSGAAVFGIFANDILAQKAAAIFPDCDCRVCHEPTLNV